MRVDKKNNIGSDSLFHVLYIFFTRNSSWLRWKYIKYMRLASYYRIRYEQNNPLFIVPFLFFQLLKNHLGYKLNFEITGSNIGAGLSICHNGPIVIHGKSVIGENCILHGDNCIGNNGISDLCPVIGNNVDIGVGAKIIGDIEIADDIVIGAGAVVVNSFKEPGSVIAGVPAKKVK